jgi:hypothetical protein
MAIVIRNMLNISCKDDAYENHLKLTIATATRYLWPHNQNNSIRQ